MHLLTKYSLMEDNDIVIQQYLPEFIKNYLKKSKEISKSEILNYYLYTYATNVLFMFVSLLIFIYIGFIIFG